MKKYIEEMTKDYTSRPLSPWHMPGHKRKPLYGGFWDDAFSRDLTEVPGTDDYHHPEGAIRDSQVAAAEVYKAAYSHYLVGGSTAGILAGILALTEIYRDKEKETPRAEIFRDNRDEMKGEAGAEIFRDNRDEMREEAGTEIFRKNKRTGPMGENTERPIFLVAGNVHRSVHHALRFAAADAVTLEPEGDFYYGPIIPEEVEKVLARLKANGEISRVAGCVITSPTYGGAISPLAEIHEILGKEGIPLLVDEAHGAHLPFIPELSEYSGIVAGAELVVQSLHKTLPALTQTGIIHVGKSGLCNREDKSNKENPDKENPDKENPDNENSDKENPDKENPDKKDMGELTEQKCTSDEKSVFLQTLERKLTHQLSVVQSSSPSYLLLASAEQAVAWADEHREEFDAYHQRVLVFRERMREVLSTENRIILTDLPWKQDPTRLFLRIISEENEDDPGLYGNGGKAVHPHPAVSVSRIAEYLEKEEGIVVELAGKDELILISTVADRDEDFERLLTALKCVAEKLNSGEFTDMGGGEDEKQGGQNSGASILKPGETAKCDIYVYPPGILIVREGDSVTEEMVLRINEELAAGRTVRGL